MNSHVFNKPTFVFEQPFEAVQRKNAFMYDLVKDFAPADKKQMFNDMRSFGDNISPDTLLTHYGLTVGQFCTMITLAEQHRKKKRISS